MLAEQDARCWRAPGTGAAVSATALDASEAAARAGRRGASLGWAGFGDDGVIHHGLFGAGARFYLSRRFSLGPELVYMVGPGQDSDLMLTGNLWVDVLAPTPAKPRRTTPFLVVGGGWFRHSDGFAERHLLVERGRLHRRGRHSRLGERTGLAGRGRTARLGAAPPRRRHGGRRARALSGYLARPP